MRRYAVAASVAAALLLVAPGLAGITAAPALYKNCTNLNKKYPHGLGKVGARDRTSGTPVTNFKRSTKLYNLAMSYNRGLDRDKDGVACEQGPRTTVSPKPWLWTPEKVVARLTAASPIVSGEVGSDILSARCTGQGPGVAGRFSGFTCETRWGGSNGSYTSTLTIRILPVGTGKLCVVTTIGAQGIPVAVPYKPGTGGTLIKPEQACP